MTPIGTQGRGVEQHRVEGALERVVRKCWPWGGAAVSC